jgi:hypothetical protein
MDWQTFANGIVRAYGNTHPNVQLNITGANLDVSKMI